MVTVLAAINKWKSVIELKKLSNWCHLPNWCRQIERLRKFYARLKSLSIWTDHVQQFKFVSQKYFKIKLLIRVSSYLFSKSLDILELATQLICFLSWLKLELIKAFALEILSDIAGGSKFSFNRNDRGKFGLRLFLIICVSSSSKSTSIALFSLDSIVTHKFCSNNATNLIKAANQLKKH